MHIHLDPIGGVAGDMFAAAMLDFHRDWQLALYEAIRGSGLAPDLDAWALQHGLRGEELRGRKTASAEVALIGPATRIPAEQP